MNAMTQPENSALAKATLELTVYNHPGVMTHVVGLFSRRAFNVDGILCMPVGDGGQSRIWLLVAADARLDNMMRQLEKLEDVCAVRHHAGAHQVFAEVAKFFV
ncbi:MAG TPA: acetolactate synthase small subunit [Rhodocyclaceae bacterium]|nr:acetolactate synthase small subunit [Rhodocyclaceae bacterium]